MSRIYQVPFDRAAQMNRWLRRNTAGALLGGSESASQVTLDREAAISTVGHGATGTVIGAPQIDVFTSSGTWTKPAGAVWVQVIIISGGAGGATGARRSSPTAGPYAGGGGGNGGSILKANFFGPNLPATLAVTVGAGGAGGTPTVIDLPRPGTAGGNSQIAGTGFPAIVVLGAALGGSSAVEATKDVVDGSIAGAGGGSITAVIVATRGGNASDKIHGLTTAGGAVPGTNGAAVPSSAAFYLNGGGAGGGAALASDGVKGGDGANGGFPGGGGGGGGAGESPFGPGSGGAGAGGLVVFLTNL